MTASELYEALQGVPAEALCVTIRYYPNPSADGWWVPDNVATPMPIAHAAALQRDAMTEWLMWKTHKSLMLVALADSVYLRNGMHFETNAPTRLHALAAACRYVGGITPPPHPAQG